MTLDPTYSINRLVIAMVEHAIREARNGDRSARRWLYGEGVLWLDAILDVHPDHIRRWLKCTLKQKKKTAQEAPGRKNHRQGIAEYPRKTSPQI